MADHVGNEYKLGDKKITVTEENERKVYFTVEGEVGTHSTPAHTFEDSVEGGKKASSDDDDEKKSSSSSTSSSSKGR